MAPGPTDLEAWLALQSHVAELDKVRKPKELKEAMYAIVSRTWDMSESRLDFVDFGVIWIDLHYRQLCNKFAEIGPGRETFDMATYRTLKTSRLEGHWDVILESLADWIESFAKDFRQSVTLIDFERILECMPPNRSIESYRSNVKNIFWGVSGSRTAGFLTQLPPVIYQQAYDVIISTPPDDGWNLRVIMSQIHDKGIVCKSVMLHVSFWFNPGLEEPANRANVKPPMFYHLKIAFSKYDSTHPMYEDDESWKPKALELQRVVLNFTLEWWPRSHSIIGNLGMLRDFSPQRYSDYISTYFWNSLLREVRRSTDVPFRHVSLTRYRDANDVPPDPEGPPMTRNESGISALRHQVVNIIRDEYSDGQTLDSAEEDDSLEVENESTFPSQFTGTGPRYTHSDSILPEPLAVESEEEGDIIHVQTPSPSYSNQSKRRKVKHVDEELEHAKGYESSSFDQHRRAGKRVVKLKVPGLYNPADQPEPVIPERPRSSPRKRPVTHSSSFPHPAQEPSPTISAPSSATTGLPTPVTAVEPHSRGLPRTSLERQYHSEDIANLKRDVLVTEPVVRTMAWSHVEQETARKALEECEGNLRSSVSTTRDSEEERRHSMSAQPAHRPRKYNLPLAKDTPTPKYSIPSPAPQSAPQPLYNPQMFMQASLPASPAPSSRTKTEQAVVLLQDEYGERLQIEEMLGAIKFLKNDLEAGIFLSLKPGVVRNAWLEDGIRGN